MLDSSQFHSSLAGTLVHRLNSTTELTADLQVEVDQAVFGIRAEGDEILVIPGRLSHIKKISTHLLSPLLDNTNAVKALEEALERMGMTIYLYNRFVGILGPGANPLLRKLVFRIAT